VFFGGGSGDGDGGGGRAPVEPYLLVSRVILRAGLPSTRDGISRDNNYGAKRRIGLFNSWPVSRIYIYEIRRRFSFRRGHGARRYFEYPGLPDRTD